MNDGEIDVGAMVEKGIIITFAAVFMLVIALFFACMAAVTVLSIAFLVGL